ncbi:glycosyl transferase [Bacteroidales bacterium]|nr:glycosyl transferase [Bacteroidales bacterium]
MMRIAILSPFYPYRGGISQFSAMLYTALGANNEVKAFSFSKLYPDFLFPGKTQYVEASDNAITINTTRSLNSINPISYITTAKQIEAFKPDVLIICYWMSFFSPAYASIASILRGKTKIISLIHNAIPHEPRFFDKALAKLFFSKCDGCIVMSETVRDDLLSLSPKAKFLMKPHPLYDHFGERGDKNESLLKLGLDTSIDRKTLLFFGLIRDYKGLDLLIDAMGILDASFQLLIAGESYGSFEKYERQINKSAAKDRIMVLNQYIDDSLVPYLFSAADVLVLPYKSATQSGVIPVAYHFEVPILATDVGDLRNTIEKPHTGLVCRANAESIAQGLNCIFEIGKEKFVENIVLEKQNLSWHIFAQEIESFAGEMQTIQKKASN